MRTQGHRLVAFSSGPVADPDNLLSHAGVRELLDDLASVDEIKTFKPDPAVYNYLVARTGSRHSACWLVPGNAWDLIGCWMKDGQRRAFLLTCRRGKTRGDKACSLNALR
jgi:2-haloacid dehalogenase